MSNVGNTTQGTVNPSGKTILSELLLAMDRAFLSALGTFTATVSVGTFTDSKAAITSAVSAAVVGLVSLGNSIRTILGNGT